MRKKQIVGMLLAMSMSIALLPAEAWAAKGINRQEATTEVEEQEYVNNQSSNPFLKYFMKYVSKGENIQNAIENAIEELENNSIFGSQIIFIGDTSQVLAD